MTHLYFNFNQARQNMVENQLRPAEVNHVKLIEIMRVLPREQCVKESQKEIAYSDISLPLLKNRFLTEPRVVARLIQLADIQQGQKVLVVGAGTGYVAAVIYLLGAETYALENDDTLTEQGKGFCKEFASGVHWHSGKLLDGLPGFKPFDVILIDGAITEIPEKLTEQLSKNGRIVAIMKKSGESSHAILAERSAGGLTIRPSFYASLSLLPELP